MRAIIWFLLFNAVVVFNELTDVPIPEMQAICPFWNPFAAAYNGVMQEKYFGYGAMGLWGTINCNGGLNVGEVWVTSYDLDCFLIGNILIQVYGSGYWQSSYSYFGCCG